MNAVGFTTGRHCRSSPRRRWPRVAAYLAAGLPNSAPTEGIVEPTGPDSPSRRPMWRSLVFPPSGRARTERAGVSPGRSGEQEAE